MEFGKLDGPARIAATVGTTPARSMTEPPHFHPAFPQPSDLSITIWRYMDVWKFEWLVANSRFFMLSASRLSDPFEGMAPDGELEWWKREAANARTAEKRGIIEYNRSFLARMAQKLRNQYYVGCWHMNSHENSAMWKCYTTTSEAVAVKTNYAALRSALPAYVEMGVVRYIDYATGRLPSMNMFEYVMHKDNYYGFEQEVRAVGTPPALKELGREDFAANHFELEAIPGFLVYAPAVDMGKLIEGVVLHPDASDTFTQRVADLCATHNLPPPERSHLTRLPSF